jgi:hypothetical protein
MEFLHAFLTPRFFAGYLDYKIHNKVRPKFSRMFMSSKMQYDPVTNDMFMVGLEEEIQKNGRNYYETRKDIFYQRDQKEKKYTAQCIKVKQKEYLEAIKKIFDKHNTNYQIIISPLYDQLCFNRSDLNYLENLFGNKHVFDFSGVNEFTNSVYNFYEVSHYRPDVGRSILKTVYQENK